MLIDEFKASKEINFNLLKKLNNKFIDKIASIKNEELSTFVNLYREDYEFDVQKKLYYIDLIEKAFKNGDKVIFLTRKKSTFLILSHIFSNNKNLILKKNFYDKKLSKKYFEDYIYLLFFCLKKFFFSFFPKFEFKRNINTDYIITNSNYDMNNHLLLNEMSEITDKVNIDNKKKIIHCPNILNINFFKSFKFLKPKNIILKEHFYKYSDVFKIFLELRKIKSSEKSFLNNYDLLINIIYIVLKYDKPLFLFYESYLNFFSFKRITDSSNNIKFFIAWWENQITTRMIFKSLNDNVSINKIAYLGYPPRNIDFRLSFSNSDYLNQYMPDMIYFIGDYYKNKFFDYEKCCKLRTVTSKRYSYLKNYNIESKDYILVSLPIFIEESSLIIDMLIKLYNDNKIILSNFVISLHPSLNTKSFEAKLLILRKNAYIVKNNCFKDYLKHSKLLISSSSGTVIESLVCGVPIALINNDLIQGSYGIPSIISQKFIHTITSSKQLLDIINKNEIYNDLEINTKYLKENIFNI